MMIRDNTQWRRKRDIHSEGKGDGMPRRELDRQRKSATNPTKASVFLKYVLTRAVFYRTFCEN